MRTAESAPLTLVTSLLGAEGVDTGTATEAGVKALSTLTPSHGAQRGRLAQRPGHAKLNLTPACLCEPPSFLTRLGHRVGVGTRFPYM